MTALAFGKRAASFLSQFRVTWFDCFSGKHFIIYLFFVARCGGFAWTDDVLLRWKHRPGKHVLGARHLRGPQIIDDRLTGCIEGEIMRQESYPRGVNAVKGSHSLKLPAGDPLPPPTSATSQNLNAELHFNRLATTRCDGFY